MAETGTDLITLNQYLAAFADDLRCNPVGTIGAACDLGLGDWLRPDAGCTLADHAVRRPATHLHEITLLGANATGDTAEAAAAHWLRVAHRLNSAATEGMAA